MNPDASVIHESRSLSLSMPSTSSRSPKSEKLQAFYSRKLATQHAQVMSNRVSQLEKIKQKAQNDIEKLKSEIQKEEQRIHEKNCENERKRRFSQTNNDNLQMRKIMNKQSREDRRKNIQDFTNSMLRDKQKLVQMKKQQTQKWLDECSEWRNKEMEVKNDNCKRLRTGYVRNLRERCATQRQHEDSIRARYAEDIKGEKIRENQAFEQIGRLEEEENGLIEDLSSTIEMRKSLKENLIRLRTLSI